MPEAFTRLVREYQDQIFRYFLRRAPHQDAPDLTSEVFIVAWDKRETIPVNYELLWLYRTAGFVLANYRRKNQPVPVDVSDESKVAPAQVTQSSPELQVVADEILAQAMGSLSKRDQEIIYLHVWEGLQGEELATVLDLQRGAADTALSRAKARLASLWEDFSGRGVR